MRKTSIFFVLVVICLLTALASDSILHSGKVTNDGLQNYQAGYNFARHLTITPYRQNPDRPSMAREPLPPALLGIWMRLVDPNLDSTEPSKVNGKPPIVAVKRFNVLIAVLLAISAFFGVKILTKSPISGLVASALTGIAVSIWGFGLNSLYTEPVAALVLMGCAMASALLMQKLQWTRALVLGVLLGSLALTKAIGLYLFIVMLPILYLLLVYKSNKWQESARCTVLVAAAFAVVVMPWIARNAYYFDEPSVALRGGRVLYYRALINDMPPDTYRAAFYVWSPAPVRKLLAYAFGFSSADLQKGGSGQWLNRSKSSNFHLEDTRAKDAGKPENTLTYIYKLRAEYIKRLRDFQKQKVPSASLAAANSMQRDGVNAIKDRPLSHIKAMLPLAWQAMWVSNLPYWLAPLIAFALPALFFSGVFRRRPDAVAFALVPMGFYTSYLATSHMLPRYIEPLVPIMIVAAVTLLTWAASSFVNWKGHKQI